MSDPAGGLDEVLVLEETRTDGARQRYRGEYVGERNRLDGKDHHRGLLKILCSSAGRKAPCWQAFGCPSATRRRSQC